ncbi:TAXI family TRAP transporter solute-binding subunit [Castellaniella sp. FW104-16D08]|uniref:TAXI family TRAP transporter solute-binding subunit n=1 Tax=unclassified Castellaniella TaxID=2617606 RepID=UPI003314DB58
MKETHSIRRRTLLKTGAAAVSLGMFPLVASAQKKRLLIGTTSSSSSQYGYFVAVSQLLNQKVPTLDTSVTETGATMDNLRRMARNQVDFGLVTTNVMYNANAGTGAFEGKPQAARLLWIYSIAPQNVVVRKDAGVENLQGLNGKKFNTGLKGSATEKTADSVLALLGVKPEVVRGSTGEIVDAVKDNRVIGYVKSGAGLKLDASSQEIAAFTPINVLSLSSAEHDKIAQAMPELSLVDVPADEASGVGAYTTWGFGLGVAAAASMNEETAYKIVKAICEDKTKQAAALADVAGADIAAMTLKYASSPLHPGAVRYFKELGLDVPAKLIG